MAYAWIIDKDHLADEVIDAAGVMGPSDAPEEFTDWLELRTSANKPVGAESYKFRMYDADGILYYTGRMVTDEGQTEEACFAPLGDYGTPAAGAVEIRYHGHPEMDCG